MITTNEILKFLNGNSSEEEKLLIEQWIAGSEANATSFEQYKTIHEQSNALENYVVNDVDLEWKNFENLITPNAVVKNIDHSKSSNTSNSWFRPLAVAASLALLLGAFFFLKAPSQPNLIEQFAETKPLNLYLEDGSKLKLDKGSKISYNDDFHEQSERILNLEGLATFEIASNPNSKMLIYANETVIEVIGTIFAVNSSLEKTSVSVEEGTVSFASTLNPGQKVLLNQGDSAEFIDGKVTKTPVQPEEEKEEEEEPSPIKEEIKTEITKPSEPKVEKETPVKTSLSKYRLNDVLVLLDKKYDKKFKKHRKCKVDKDASVMVDLMMDLDDVIKQIEVEYELEFKESCEGCYEVRSIKEK